LLTNPFFTRTANNLARALSPRLRGRGDFREQADDCDHKTKKEDLFHVRLRFVLPACAVSTQLRQQRFRSVAMSRQRRRKYRI